ncbi:MAG: hypothetical protein K6T80_06345 [Firmicutes bacterium]|nr:hypothetical protein [Bacillota bacterium]
MVLEDLFGPIAFLVGAIVMFLIVPWDRVKDRAFFGVVSGLGMALALIYLMQNIFGFWTFRGVDLVYLAGMPVFLAAVWTPLVITFAYLIAHYNNITMVVLILTGFPLIATIAHYFLVENRMLAYSNWNLVYTFFLAAGIHLGIALYLYLTGRLENLRGLFQREEGIG